MSEFTYTVVVTTENKVLTITDFDCIMGKIEKHRGLKDE